MAKKHGKTPAQIILLWHVQEGFAVIPGSKNPAHIRASGFPREDVFLSTKLWPSDYANPNAVDETLERLGTDYVDLLFIHQPAGDWLAGYRQLEKA